MKQRLQAYRDMEQAILNALSPDPKAKFLDLGCDDGVWTQTLANKIGTTQIYGVDVIDAALKQAKSRGIRVKKADLNQPLPYQAKQFDVIHANQVIEHLNNTDQFMAEIHRLLKPGGYAIIATENLASWHNIGALVLGYTPFSLTNISNLTGAVGNPLAPHADQEFWSEDSWQHQRVFTTKGLSHLSQLHGFNVDHIHGSGYYPLPTWFAQQNPGHAAFIVLRISKK